MNRDVEASRRRVVRNRAASDGVVVGIDDVVADAGPGEGEGGGMSAEDAAALGALLDRAPSAVLTPESIDGPYWFDVDTVRGDLREDRPGLDTHLALRVVERRGDGFVPVGDAVVEVWHCDAGGVYSGFEELSRMEIPIPMGEDGLPIGPPPGGDAGPSDGSYSAGVPESGRTDDGTYLRGAQPTDADGIAYFTTIYPGWYVSRTVHIHVKVHRARRNVLTAQLFLDDRLNDEIFATVYPYTDHVGRDTRNDTDFIYTPECRLAAERARDGGVLAAITLGVSG
ncbi:protocatechuate dioxygenase [Actinomadura meridiana]|uniref:Protocatechuate dioxygenase n=1 Tax=Actinomadura meridiana TaxID=559626 RepID=A0ABP8C9P7_9ACTN